MELIKGRGALSTPICVKKERNAQGGADQGFSSQPRQLPCARHPALHFCYHLALETSFKYSSIEFLRGDDLCHAHSASLQWSGPPTSECFFRLKAAYNARNGLIKRQRSLIYTHLCQKGEKCSRQCRPGLFYSQPTQPVPLASYPGSCGGGEKRAWYRPFAHALNYKLKNHVFVANDV